MTSNPIFFNKDSGTKVVFNVKNPDGTIRDLTGATVVLEVEGLSTSPRPVTVTNALLGQCRYTVEAGIWATAGTYRAQLLVTQSANSYNSEVFTIEVPSTVY